MGPKSISTLWPEFTVATDVDIVVDIAVARKACRIPELLLAQCFIIRATAAVGLVLSSQQYSEDYQEKTLQSPSNSEPS